MMVLSILLTRCDHQLNAVYDFNLLFVYLEHKIKRIIALSLNWDVNFKLFYLEMGENGVCICNRVLSFIKINKDKL